MRAQKARHPNKNTQLCPPARLLSIKAAAKQVVAGLNWRLVLEVDQGDIGKKTVTATVYQPLGGGGALQVTALE